MERAIRSIVSVSGALFSIWAIASAMTQPEHPEAGRVLMAASVVFAIGWLIKP